MGFFSRKQRVRLDVFCRKVYDGWVSTGIDALAVECDTLKRFIAEVDPRFGTVDAQRFLSETTLIRFEVFGLAWLHQLGEKHAAAQSAFTKSYLEERGQADVWQALQAYNQAIARSSHLRQTWETGVGRGYLTFINSIRVQVFDQWNKQGFEPETVGRAANRLCTEVAWKESLTAGFLMLTLCERLGCEVNEEAQFRLVAFIRAIYSGTRDGLKLIKVEA